MPGRTKVLEAVAAAISCILLLASCSASPSPSEAAPIPSTTPSPTPSEPTALETFAELRKRADAIYAERDFKGMKDVYSRGGPTWGRVLTDLKVMRRAGVTFQNLDRALARRVVTETENQIVIRETIVSDGRFLSPGGEDVTGERKKERQVIRWILRNDGSGFLVYDSTILRARPIERP